MLFFLLLTFPALASGLFEDQVGKFDWRVQLVGRVRSAAVEPSAGVIVIGTEQNVVALLNLLDGTIIWRQMLTQKAYPGYSALVAVRKQTVISLSADGRTIYAFDKGTGILKWERANSQTPRWLHMHYNSNRDNLRLVAASDDKKLLITDIDAINGAVSKTTTINAAFYRQDRCTFVSASLICLDAPGEKMTTLDVSSSTSTPTVAAVTPTERLLAVNGLDADHYALLTQDQRTLFYRAADGKLLKEFNKRMDAISVIKDTVVAVLADTITVLDATTGAERSKISVQKQTADLKELFPYETPSGLRFLASLSDDTFVAFNEQGRPLWLREEALASILSVEMLDLPLSEEQANIEEEFSDKEHNILTMLIRRLTTQAAQARKAVLDATEEVLALSSLFDGSLLAKSRSFSELMDTLNSRRQKTNRPGTVNEKLERDYFNLRKMIVAVTESGKVLGVPTEDRGVVRWSLWLGPDVRPLTLGGGQPMFPLFVQRTTAHYPHPARCSVLAHSKKTGNGLLISFDPITGEIADRVEVGFPIGHASLIPQTNEEDLHGVIVTNHKNTEAKVIPSDVLLSAKQQPPMPVFIMNAESDGTLDGFKFDGNGGLDKVWRSVLPLVDGQTLATVRTKRITERVHSVGRVLGDRSVLYKYINPSLVAVTALGQLKTTATGASASKSPTVGDSLLTVFLVDAVTGTVLFSAKHPRASAPLHLVHCENWVLYTFWNEKTRRTELNVLELYEGTLQSDPVKFSSLAPTLMPPTVYQQSYVFPQSLTAMAVTETEMGLTNRQLLLALPFGGVMEVPKGFLDPRRTITPTPEQREEGLVPYMPEIPVATENIINYNQTVVRIRQIHTSASGLESTSLVLVYGLDLFFTRATPSGTFDILKDDFDHWFISAVVAALIISSFISKRLARDKDLKQAWK